MSQEQGHKKIVSLSFLFAAVLFGMLTRELAATLWVEFELVSPAWVLSPADLIGVGLGLVCFLVLSKNTIVKNFMFEVVAELEKVTWPKRNETVTTTGVVSVLVAICAMILFGFDMLWGSLLGLFYQ